MIAVLACGQARPNAAPASNDADAIYAAGRAVEAQRLPTTTPAPVITPTPVISEQQKAEATALLAAAKEQFERGEIGLSLDLITQALAKWPDLPNGRELLSLTRTLATAQSGTAVAQLTAVTRDAQAQQTAVAQHAMAQATAEADAKATAAAAPRLGRAVRAGNWQYVVNDAKPFTVLGSVVKTMPKGRFLVVGVTVTNVGKENFGLNTWDFELYSADGVKYTTASAYVESNWFERQGYGGGALDFSSGAKIPPGVPIKYAVVYDVAPDIKMPARLRLVQAKIDVALT